MSMTSLVIASASRVFCCSVFPGQSFTMTCGMFHSSDCPGDRRGSFLRLLVADLLHPLDHFAVLLLLNGNVGHSRGEAPCQCFSSGEKTPSPGWMSSMGPPQRCARPQPAVTISV